MADINIKFYGYNGFIIKSDAAKIAVDPGANLYLFGLGPVIPRSEWQDITHVVVTHADPDHYWHTDRVAEASGAPVICGRELVETREGKTYMVSPRKKKLQYATEVGRVIPMGHGDEREVDGVGITALPIAHGDLEISVLFGLIKKTVIREPNTLFAKGETGFILDVEGVRIVNLGDTLLLPGWGRMAPDILMLPIGGKKIKNTMDEQAALKAVEMIQPKLVIPTHYNCGVLFSKAIQHTDAMWFKNAVEKAGVPCVLMEPGQGIDYPPPGTNIQASPSCDIAEPSGQPV
jgi:L-ascorbate metabolism protein UlaG (beta-lactamase superfamily)